MGLNRRLQRSHVLAPVSASCRSASSAVDPGRASTGSVVIALAHSGRSGQLLYPARIVRAR